MIYAMTSFRSSAVPLSLSRLYNSLDKEQTDSNTWLENPIGQTRQSNFPVDCRNGISNDLVLQLGWEIFEGEDASDLFVGNDQYPKYQCRWREDKHQRE